MNTEALGILALGIAIGCFIGHPVSSFKNERNVLQEKELEDLVAKLTATERVKVEGALRQQHKIEAIRIFRAATNAGLRDARASVELMMRC